MTIKFNLSKIKKYYPNLNCKKKNFLKIEDQILKILNKSHIKKEKIFNFSEFGKILFPYNSMGKIKSFHLFNANEFIIFFLYLIFKKQNKTKVADLGANLGLHSIVLDKCGFNVKAYEPDPITYYKLKKNIILNKCKNVKVYNAAIYNKSGVMRFTRVKDNLTGSHLGNLKKSYGEKEFFKVKIKNIKNIINEFDLIKMDIESAEAKVLCSLLKKNYFKTDFIVEIGNKDNSEKIFNFLTKKKLKFFSQKNNFKLVKKFKDMPFSHKDGALVISQNNFKL
jgi:FkbM family methyltransferase